MKMYDVEVSLDGGDVWIVQDCGIDDSVIIKLHPDQVPLVCEWLMQAVGGRTETREVKLQKD